jgi:hypothetical protein
MPTYQKSGMLKMVRGTTMASGDNIITIRDERGRYQKGMPGGPGRPVGSRNRLSEHFLADLQADWQQHGNEILPIIREKYPDLYFRSMVNLALTHRIELGQPRDFDRPRSPEEVLAQLEDRVGPEGRRLFEDFLRNVKLLEQSSNGSSD